MITQKEKIRGIVVCLVLALCLTGCGADADNKTKSVTLDVMTPFGEGDGNHSPYAFLCEKFESETGVVLNDLSVQSNESWKGEVLASFTNGSEPDVLFYFTKEDAEPFVSKGKVVDVNQIRAVYPEYAGDITPSLINALSASDGKPYAIPVMGYWEGLFINRDLFDGNGVKVPETWEDLLESIRRFNEIGITPVAAALGDIPHYWFEFLLYNYTGPSGHMKTIPSLENTRMDYWGKGLNDFKLLYELGAFPEDTLTMSDNDSFALFAQKKAAMLIDGSWKVGAIEDTDQVEVVFFPSSSNARQNTDIIGGFSMGFYITQKAWDDPDKRDAAVSFVQAMVNEEAVTRFGANGAALPINKKPAHSDSPLLASIANMSLNATAFTPAVQDTIRQDVREYLFGMIPLIAAGEADTEEVLKNFAELNQ